MAICVDEENAFCLNKIGDKTPDTEPISYIDFMCIFAVCSVISGKKRFILVVVVGGGGGDWGDCCGGAAE